MSYKGVITTTDDLVDIDRPEKGDIYVDVYSGINWVFRGDGWVAYSSAEGETNEN